MHNHEKYADILSRAVADPTEEEAAYLNPTDHGWLRDDDFNALISRRLKPLLKSQYHVRKAPDGSLWRVSPDGERTLIER